jgi:hypothetical protein
MLTSKNRPATLNLQAGVWPVPQPPFLPAERGDTTYVEKPHPRPDRRCRRIGWLGGTAQAGGNISWSVGINAGPPVVYGPPPVYMAPQPVYGTAAALLRTAAARGVCTAARHAVGAAASTPAAGTTTATTTAVMTGVTVAMATITAAELQKISVPVAY